MTSKKLSTLLVHDGKKAHSHGAVVPPIYQNSLFTMESWEEIDESFENRTESHIYSRATNPSVTFVERKIAEMAGGERARLFGSGMAAISAAVLSCIKSGSHVVTINNIYGPTNNLLQQYFKNKFDVTTTSISGTDIGEFEKALKPNTHLIYLESPSSVVYSLQDIEAVAELASSKGIKTIIDNTWATPLFQQPLSMGIDFEVHSASKYLGGHSDLVAGVVIGKEDEMKAIQVQEGELIGGKMAPFEAWLLLRSLRTFPIRMQYIKESALKIASFLENHPMVQKVYYPGLPSHPQYELGKRQMSGYSGLMSFRLKTEDLDSIKKFYNNLKYFQIGVSWGGHESLIYAPAISYLKELTEDQFKAMGIHLGDIRISVGLEDTDDLIQDLEQNLRYV